MKDQALDPLVSEFATEAAAADYDRWFRAKVRAALDDTRSSVAHDEAMTRVNATIKKAQRKRVSA